MGPQETIKLAYGLLKKINESRNTILAKFDSTEKQQALFEFLQYSQQYAATIKPQDERDLLAFSQLICRFVLETSQLEELWSDNMALDQQLHVTSETDEKAHRDSQKSQFYHKRLPNQMINEIHDIRTSIPISDPPPPEPAPSGTVTDRSDSLWQRLQRFWRKTGN